ncbi:MAG: hypothetical protein IJY25_05075 [Bacilli bacterium]|nr:hypothetical protein [Bacilli bacterium]
MILKKPYAFFIKMFKPIHLILAILTAYLIYLDNKILTFFNEYIYSNINVVGENISENLVNNFLYIIPIIIIVFSMIIFGIMYNKKKPTLFYIFNILAFIVVIIINIYTISFINVLEKSVVSIKMVKLIHDLVVINMGLSSLSFVFLIIRGIGINFKKFSFDNDISKMDITESDKEEFEVNINIDIDEKKRQRKEKFRKLKYSYVENKFLINLCIIIVLVVIVIATILIINLRNKENVEGNIYSVSTFNFGVTSTTILNTDYKGNTITDEYLIVVDTKLMSNYSGKSLYLKDFSLRIGEAIFKPTKKYSENLKDLGTLYDGQNLENQFNNYLFVYEISEKYIESDMYFSYSDQGKNISIKLNPKEIISTEISVTKQMNEEISFEDSLGNIKFKINEYEIKDKYLIEYNYCIKDNDCLLSREYLNPTINKNFDKTILRLGVEYSSNTNLDINTFYKFFSQFGSISYKIGDNWYEQSSSFEEIKSNKVSDKVNTYIGVNEVIMNAESIKLVFNIRGAKYEYVLK